MVPSDRRLVSDCGMSDVSWLLLRDKVWRWSRPMKAACEMCVMLQLERCSSSKVDRPYN